MRIAVMGAGGIGTWVGAALARAGHDVALIARGAHLEAMRSDGVQIRDSEGGYVVHPQVTGDSREVGQVDAVILAVKAHDQAAAGPAVSALLGPGTMIVAAQNGLPWWYFHGLGAPWDGRRLEGSDPGGTVSAALAPEHVLGCVVYLGAEVVEPGVVQTRPEAGLVLGEPDGSATPRLAAVADALESAAFDVRRSPAIRTEIWTKLMGNLAFNTISVLTRAGLGTMASEPAVREVAATIMAEAIAVAEAVGAAPSISIERRLEITARLDDHKPSSLQDLEAGKRVELDAMAGAVVELAGLAGVPVPTLRTVHALAGLAVRQASISTCGRSSAHPRRPARA